MCIFKALANSGIQSKLMKNPAKQLIPVLSTSLETCFLWREDLPLQLPCGGEGEAPREREELVG